MYHVIIPPPPRQMDVNILRFVTIREIKKECFSLIYMLQFLTITTRI